jgi:hypothetical protein
MGTLMRTIFSSLVAASLLIHAAFGCCQHDAHRDVCVDDHEAERVCDADGNHHHDCVEHHGQPADQPCGGHHCQGQCNYLPVQKSQPDDLKVKLPLDFVAVLPAGCDVRVVALHHAEWLSESVAGPPVRLHLLHQILLI